MRESRIEANGAAALAPGRWRRLVTIGVPPPALDERIFSDYDQLKRLFYDATEDLRRAKRCLRDPRRLAAAIAYYRAEEPGLLSPEFVRSLCR